MREQNPHRGPGKAGKKQISVHVSEDELSALKSLADENCRSVSHQVLWLVRQAISKAPPALSGLPDSAFLAAKASLEDYQSQTGCRITKKMIADSVKNRGLGRQEAADVRGRLAAVFCR